MSVTTDAWVLYPGKDPKNPEPATLQREPYTIDAIADQEVLVESLYGCWEGNMAHALDRKPVDICRQRKEEKVVIGNAGVVRILECGSAVTTLKALTRQGILTTAGWKHGMVINTYRAMECISRHQHIHTHYARYPQGRAAVRFAAETGWIPHLDPSKEYDFDDIPELAKDYAEGKCSYFPIYRVNGIQGNR